MSRSALVLALGLLATPALAAPAPTPVAVEAAVPGVLPERDVVLEPARAEAVQIQERAVEVQPARQERSTSYRAIYLLGVLVVIIAVIALIA
ncbi:hypothetical protein BH20GEM2_BH20GEM2_13740 [soil metagenome]|jgi:hypothetical protein